MDDGRMADGVLRGAQRILDFIYQKMMQKKIQNEEQELMQKMLNGMGPVMGSAVPASHLQEIKRELIRQNIPFIAAPNSENGCLFLIRKENEGKLLAIEEAVSAQDTRLAKELGTSRGLQIARSQGIKQMTTLSFNDKEMMEIAKQKLFQSGSTFISYSETLSDGGRKHKLSVFPSALFKINGKDLEFFKLNYCLLQARDRYKAPDEAESELIKVRKAQADFDNRQVSDFIAKARAGQHVVLGDNRGNGAVYIEAINGNIVVHDKRTKEETKVSYFATDTNETIAATLSRYTEDIYNMNVTGGDFYNENMRDTRAPEEILKNYHRPQLSKNSPYYNIHAFMGHDCEALMKRLNAEATNRVLTKKKYYFMSPEQRAQAKHKELIALLQDKNHPFIKEFLEREGPVSPKEREAILDDVCENFSNESQNTRHSVDVDVDGVSEIEKLLVNMERKRSKKEEQERKNENERD